MALDPDAELMMKVRRGNRAAFEVLVIKYQKSVINTIYRSLNDPIEAEDLTQNVFVQVWKTRSRYKPSAKFRRGCSQLLVIDASTYSSGVDRLHSTIRIRSLTAWRRIRSSGKSFQYNSTVRWQSCRWNNARLSS